MRQYSGRQDGRDEPVLRPRLVDRMPVPQQPVAQVITRRWLEGMPQPEEGIVQTEHGYLWVPCDLIDPEPDQPRHRGYGDAEDEAFNAGIAVVGQQSPGVLRVKPDGRYGIIAGERRFRAVTRAGFTHFKTTLSKAKTKEEFFEEAAIDNTGRKDLHCLDAADMVAQFQTFSRFSQLALPEQLRGIALTLSKTESWVKRHHYLNLLHPTVRAMLEPTVPEGQRLSAAMGAFIGGKIRDESEQVHIARMAISQGLTVRQAEAYHNRRQEAKRNKRPLREVQPLLAEDIASARRSRTNSDLGQPGWGGRVTASDHAVLLGCLTMFAQDLKLFQGKFNMMRQMFVGLPKDKQSDLLKLMEEICKDLAAFAGSLKAAAKKP